MHILGKVYFGNSLLAWIVAFLVALIVYAVLSLIRRSLGARLRKLAERSANDIENLLSDMLGVRTKKISFLCLALYCASLTLVLPAKTDKTIIGVVFVVLFIQMGLWGNGLIHYFVNRRAVKDGEEGLNLEAYSVISWIAKAALWATVVLLALNNLGVQITALVAGLGISGIAVALAVQSILGDLFASLSIVLDRPFVVGDFIIVGDQMGSVEHVGLKTTRVRSLSGEQIIIANNDLLNSRIKNYGRMNERRVLFSVGVTYQTPKEKLEEIPGIIREAIEAQNKVRFDRSNFSKFGAYSLDFETVYYVLDRDYNFYMNIQERIILAIYERFSQEGIEFAYPTQTLFMEKG